MMLMVAWIPHVLYSHLVIQDYLAHRLPERMVVCPEDRYRLDWQKEPTKKFDVWYWGPDRQPNGWVLENRRWPYSSTYQVVPAAYDRSPQGQRLWQDMQSGAGKYFMPQDSALGDVRLTDVDLPSVKVHMMDDEDRHTVRQSRYYAAPGAVQSLLAFDGSVRRVGPPGTPGGANGGWQPNIPSAGPTLMPYAPSGHWQAAPSNGGDVEIVRGLYRWTRSGIAGVDFGGAER